LLGVALGVILLGMAGFVALYFMVAVPSANAQATAQANIYKTADGKVIARSGAVNRQSVPLSQVPVAVQHAFVAAENKTFYTDRGVDLRGMARAAYDTLTGKGLQGGSTITQQYVKNYYLDQNQTVTRKVKELIISLKVDQEKSKNEILAGYLNTSYFGRGAYGIQAAAQAYYGVDVSKLTPEQGAYLAALVQAPSQYDVSTATAQGKQFALARWNYVLDNMVGMHWLDPAQRRGAVFPQPLTPKGVRGVTGQNGYLIDAADRQLTSSGALTDAQLAAGGWTITLTIDPAKQRAMEEAVKTQLTDNLSSSSPVDQRVQPGAVSVDPKTGDVVALYGGAGYPQHYTDNATRDDYQVASTFKPIVLASALQNNSTTQDGRTIGADTIYDGTSGRPVQGTSTPFAPPNEDNRSYGRITVQTAMDNSVNSVFAQLAVDVGLDKVAQTACALGMPSATVGLNDGPAIALGTMGASPMTMAGIYATLDDHGQKVTPTIVKSAVRGGESVSLPHPLGSQVISRSAADTVTSVLTGVVNSGTGTAAQQASQVAGKTGTSDNNKSAWFTGYTPDLVTSIGLFGQDPKNGSQVSLSGAGGGGRVNGGGFPAQIWGAYTRAALSSESPLQFDLQTKQGAAVQSQTIPSAPPLARPSASPSLKPSPSPSLSPSSTPSTKPSRSPAPMPSITGPATAPPTGPTPLPPTPSAMPTGRRTTPPGRPTPPGQSG
ncbi:MAG: penicillin-binding protein, partial [Streptomycetaceae bacterium]|nr:penicillin-binding protein [Streptomycetaceae bacterium]